MVVIARGIIPRLYMVRHTFGFLCAALAISLITRFTRSVMRPSTVTKSIISKSVPLVMHDNIMRSADKRTEPKVIYFAFTPCRQAFPALRKRKNKYVPNRAIIKAIAAI